MENNLRLRILTFGVTLIGASLAYRQRAPSDELNKGLPDGSGSPVYTELAWRVSQQVQLGMGFAQVFPGEFLKRTTSGKPHNFPYWMASYAF